MNIKTAHPFEDNPHGRLKIFVSAYACEPDLGSEIGVGWHWVLEMSKHFDIWVLTRESNRHNIEPWIASHPEYQDIHWLYYDWPKWARFWKKGLRGVRTYYNLWQLSTNKIVKRTMQDNNIRIFHHLTYGNVLWKVSKYGQKQFFVWGPVGGLESIPSEFSNKYDLKNRIVELIRRRMASLAHFNSGFKKRCRNADLILCKTEITRKFIPDKFADKALLFTDVAADATPRVYNKAVKDGGVTEFITVGRLDAWRGFDLIIEATEAAIRENDQIHVTILGDGSDRTRLEKIVKQKSLHNYISMPGKVSMDDYRKRMSESDAVINAALKEGAVTVSFDAMSMGLPLICIDTTGYTRYFADDYAILIPRTTREEVVRSIKDGMVRLTNPDVRRQMGINALAAASRITWEQHGLDICETILKAYYNSDTGSSNN